MNGRWIKVPIGGNKPQSRYGHSMIFFKPFILLVGGNIGNEPSNEVWFLSIDKSPFFWKKIDFNMDIKTPSPRVYHSLSLWKSPEKGEMVLMFGGRNKKGEALNDLWGLRRHNNGIWDWIQAENKNKRPTNRYQHSMMCSKNLVVLIGGRNNVNMAQNQIMMEVYNLLTQTWYSFPGVNRFRHVSWLSFNNLYTHGGFENNQPNLPINLLTKIDLKELFANYPDLLKNIEEPYINQNSQQNYQIAN